MMDGALAWDIQKWNSEQDRPTLSTAQVEGLATYLSDKGWGAAKRDVSLGDVRGLVEKGRKLVDDLLGEPRRADAPGQSTHR
ncbi:hypothetical protein MYRNA_213 [Mycobacterium phage Myrna]|uniref:Uncharacterized protein n=1 Tax=Mycobacterium phage Myrna TaxID=546805 RepID=B5LJI3_9CAUD|nr:gp213 [Mycobacterium phage Myrna]ACH62180.1 hypothetical protein MYRNA_213 [Mycobacterium phage Myrna]